VSNEGIAVVNFAHPLTEAQREQIKVLTGRPVVLELGTSTQVDVEGKVEPQVAALVDRVGLSNEEWQTLPLLVNPPGLAPLTAVLLAELHGRMGYFPTLIRIRPVLASVPQRYEVAELLNLQAVRDAARERRQMEEEPPTGGEIDDDRDR
jgi:hypothetical protein